jgi:hypothetical protein
LGLASAAASRDVLIVIRRDSATISRPGADWIFFSILAAVRCLSYCLVAESDLQSADAAAAQVSAQRAQLPSVYARNCIADAVRACAFDSTSN